MTSVNSSMFTGLISTISAINSLRQVSASNRDSSKRTKAPIADVKIPEVNPQIVCRDVSLLVRIDGYGVDMVGVSIRIHFTRHGRDDVVLLLHPR